MEKDILDLTTQLCGLLSRCGVSSSNQEKIWSHVQSIAHCVYESRLEAGLQGVPDCLKNQDISLFPNKSRQSERLLSATEKRGRPDYAGQDDRPRPKKTKCAMSRKAMKDIVSGKINSEGLDDAETGETETGETETGETETDETEANEAPTGEKETGKTDSGEAGRDGARQQAVPATEHSQIAEQTQPPLEITNADGRMAEHTGVVQGEELQGTSGPPPAASAPTPDARQAEPTTDVPAALTGNTLRAPLLDHSSTVFSPPPNDTEKENQVMDTIFLCCLHYNFHLSRYRKHKATTTIRTEVSDIQRQANDVLKLTYTQAVDVIRREHTAFYSKKMQARYMETIFWHLIEEKAEDIDPEDCPVSRGPLDGFTRQEKKAHRDFMVDAGYKIGATNTRHYRLLWKNLYALRQGGIDKILLYRTKEFTSFCETFCLGATPSLLDTVMPWEERYGPQISLLEKRIENASKNGFGADPLLSQPGIADRLKVERKAWNSDSNRWYSEQEAASFAKAHGLLTADSHLQGNLRDIPTKKGQNRDMSLFVVLKPLGKEEIVICPVMTIKPGDFLGIFSGEIRYADNLDEAHGIPGPKEKLWLDYSRVTGALNLMRVTLPGQDANVHLQWESYRPDKKSQAIWRVAVRAARVMKPFEEMTRSACHELQYKLHQDLVSARRGFLRPS